MKSMNSKETLFPHIDILPESIDSIVEPKQPTIRMRYLTMRNFKILPGVQALYNRYIALRRASLQ